MGAVVLVYGDSGTGKSTSLRNFEDGTIGVFNTLGKPLPFRSRIKTADHAGYDAIMAALKRNTLHAYVIDDAGYLMSNENFARVKESGYGKFVDMASHFQQLIQAATKTDSDTLVYIFMHSDADAMGKLKPKTVGKMLDEKYCIEGACPIVIHSAFLDGRYVFEVANDGINGAKAPMGMFAEPVIDNDLAAVDAVIREYWGMAPLGGGQHAEPTD